jgi:hypothetical protein
LYPEKPWRLVNFAIFFGFAKDKVKPLAVIMDKPGQSLPFSVIHAEGRKF